MNGATPPNPKASRTAAERAIAAFELLQFKRQLHGCTPRLWVTPALVALNVTVWVIQLVLGVDATTPSAQVLFEWGGNRGVAVGEGEYWRLLTATALHGGALHLAFNMFALWVIGQTVERVLGNTGFAVTYLLSGLAGSVASAIATPDVVSVGASGAVFGILGAQLTGLLNRRVGLPRAMRPRVMRDGLFFIGINLAFGFSVPNIDNAAHVGGLIAGLMCGGALAHELTVEAVRYRTRRALTVMGAGLALLVTTFVLVPTPEAGLAQRTKETLLAVDTLHASAVDLEQQRASGLLSDAEVASHVVREIIPAARRLLEKTRRLDLKEPMKTKLVDVASARLDMYAAFAETLTHASPKSARRFQEASERSEAAIRNLQLP